MKLTIGIIGLTHPHSAGYLRTLDVCERVTDVIACDSDPEVCRRVAHEHAKVRETCTKPQDLLDRADVPIVVVALPTDVVPATVIAAARAGKHVFCEKPCARSAEEIRPVVAALAEARVQFGVAYMWRANPAILKMRELVRDGVLGRLTSVELRMVTTQVGLRNPSHWLFQCAVAGGGILSWLGCHWLDLLRYVTDQEVAAVGAMLGTLGGEAIDVEDVGIVQMRLSGGALASLHAGYLLPFGRTGYEGTQYDNTVILRGTEGFARHQVAGAEQVVTVESRASTWRTAHRQELRFTLPESPAYGGQHGLLFFEDFVMSALDGKGSPFATVEDAQRVLEILDAAYASAETGHVIDMEQGRKK